MGCPAWRNVSALDAAFFRVIGSYNQKYRFLRKDEH